MSRSQKSWALRLSPLAVIAAAVALSLTYDLSALFSPQGLADNKDRVFAWIEARPFLTGLGFQQAQWFMPLIIPVLAGIVAFFATRAAARRTLGRLS